MNYWWLLIGSIWAFHVYLDGTQPTCFTEDLPVGTTIVGKPRAVLCSDSRVRWLAGDALDPRVC